MQNWMDGWRMKRRQGFDLSIGDERVLLHYAFYKLNLSEACNWASRSGVILDGVPPILKESGRVTNELEGAYVPYIFMRSLKIWVEVSLFDAIFISLKF